MKGLGYLGACTAAIFFTASIFYGTVSQCDTDVWAVNLVGLWGSTIAVVVLLVATCMPAWASRCHRSTTRQQHHGSTYPYAGKDHDERRPGLPHNGHAKINSDDGRQPTTPGGVGSGQ